MNRKDYSLIINHKEHKVKKLNQAEINLKLFKNQSIDITNLKKRKKETLNYTPSSRNLILNKNYSGIFDRRVNDYRLASQRHFNPEYNS